MVGYYQTDPIPSPATMSVASVGVPTLETMNPVKSLVCSPDLTVFASPPCGAENLTTPTDDKPYQCLLCQKSFEQKSLYQSHLRSHGKDGEDPYRCNICSKTFAVPARLTRHYRTHTGEKPYQCEYCSKSFSVKENLSVHRRIHTNERPYKCDVCERAFEHSGKLHRHMRIHTGERPHKCTVCSKTFIQSGQLVIHMRTHTGEKPYVCKSCGKGFTCSKQLKVHTRTHTGEKPYTCDICGKSFGYNHVLKLHQVAHYGEKVYKCTLCHETFGSKKTMELHIKTHSDSSSSSSSSASSNGTSPRDSPIEPVVEISQSIKAASPSPINIVQHHELAEQKYLDQKYMDQKYAEQKYMEPRFVQSPQSISSDKENKGELEKMEHKTEIDICPPEAYQRDFPYYIYPREQYPQPVTPVNVSLLAGVDVERSFPSSVVPTPVEPTHVFLYPEVAPAYTTFGLQTNDLGMSSDCSSLLNLPGNDARRRVEAALEAVEEERQREYGVKVDREPMLTPPSSNPVSPAPSPDPLDLAIPVRETLILPPRKRCKMILESMESERSGLIASQRQSSVIQFARAS